MSVTRFAGFMSMLVTRFVLSNVAESITVTFLRASEQLIGFVGMPIAACSPCNDRCYSYTITCDDLRVYKVRGLRCCTTSGTGGLGRATGP